MIYFYHGEDFVSSRNSYNSQKDSESILIDAVELDKNLLLQLTGASSLFQEHKKVFIDNFFSKKSSKNFEEILGFFDKARHLDIYIWSDKEIPVSQFKSFSKFDEQNFKVPQNIFGFVDNISPNSTSNVTAFHKILPYSNPEFIFTMIVRQFRLMLSLSSSSKQNIDETTRLRDWQTGKLKRQLTQFGEENLKSAYKKLGKIDKSQKTGATRLSLVQAIDMFLLQI